MHRYIPLALLALFGVAFLASPSDESAGTVRHVVAFKFKEDASPEQISQVVEAFRALKNKIDVIVSFEAGTNVSPEGLNKGFTHCFILTFRNEKDRDAYLVHPAHKEFGELVGPLLADVFVVDFWAD
ncbi:MAG: Dabb family protein [Acidobacteriota bacterium]